MELIADILLIAGAVGAGIYCFILGRRLKSFNSLEKGVGGAVAVLSSQVEELKQTLESAQKTASASTETLADLNVRAEEISKRLEIQLAALHDVPGLSSIEAKEKKNEERDETENNDVLPKQDHMPAEPMFVRHVAGAR